MNYIISENQLKLLIESNPMMWVKRRVTRDVLEKYLRDAEQHFPNLCDEFSDEFDYSQHIIQWAVDDFLTSNEDIFLGDDYDEISEKVVDMCKKWFGQEQMEIYINTCLENA